MVDTSDWGGLPDVKIDMGAAEALVTGCENAATTIRSQCTGRRSATTTAMQDFEGRFSELFQQNQTQANTDGEEIAKGLQDVANAVRYLVSIIPAENERRKQARDWKKRHDEDKSGFQMGDLLGDEPPPNDGPTSPPAPPVLSANASERDTPPPGSGGGGGGGTSSARPDKLRDFVTGVSGQIEALNGKPSTLGSRNDAFTAGFDWGTGETTKIDGSTVYNAFRQYNELNRKDKVWVNTVAGAFEEAGGSGAMVTISNAALTQALNAAGVPASRQDIPSTSPMLMGIAPTTGYSDDPVNAATGNFVEPETDLDFPGACAELVLSRMYNSFNADAGAFGAGWVSWTEVGLVLGDESASFTHPDGRVSELPRLGAGWDRALGESLWLAHDEQADELRLTDNDGGTWRFTTSGVALSHDRGEGTMVSLVREDGRLVRLEHERGRSVDLTWDGDRVVAVATSDGRTVTYSYDEGVRLVAVTGDLGTRTYRWNDAGLIEAVVDADGVVEVENTYDEQNRVTTQLSPHGRVSRYTYLPGHVTEVADRDGTRANTWVHDGRGRLIGLVDSDGNRQSRAYDQHGNEVVVTERDGTAVVREFDGRGHVVREVLPSGSDMGFEYDEKDRLVRATTQDGAQTVLSYEGVDRQPSLVLDPEGGETRLEWSAGFLTRLVDPMGVAVLFDHDEHGNLVSTTSSAGDTARFEHDARGRVVAATTPSGRRTTYVHGPTGLVERHDPDGAVWRYEHTSGGRLAAVVDPTGARSSIEFGTGGEPRSSVDELGRATTRHLDDLGNLASVELPDGSSWRFAYDALSRLTSTTSPDGHTWSQAWNSVTGVVSTVDPLGRTSSSVTDESDGTVVTTDASGTFTQHLDPLGRLLSEEVDGSSQIATYDRCGRVVELLDAEAGLTRIERDAAGRMVAVTDPTGLATRYEYDACGRRSAVVEPGGHRTTIEYDADSLPVRCVLPSGEIGWSEYDACGRVSSSWTPGVGGARLRYDAAGRVVEIHDTASGLRRFTYDAAGQLVTATNGNGGVTRYDYDALGRATTITDALGHVTRREFDSMDRCTAETDPLGRTTRAGYDAVGRQVWQEDAAGRRTEWVYDEADRVVEIRVAGRTVATNTWDTRGRVVRTSDRTREDGRVIELSSQWNRRGQVERATRDGVTQSWEYDAAGRRTAMTFPDGSRVSYRWDSSGWLEAVEHPLLGRASFERDGLGRVVAATAGDLVQSWEYADGFVVAHSVTGADGAVRTVVDRDEDGRILRVDRGGEATRFDYDAAHQLVEQHSGDERVRWRYDAAGRVVSESGPSGAREFSYDAASQLLTVDDQGATTRHSYDEAGRRVRTEFPDGRTRVLGWAPTGSLASVLDESGGTSNRIRLHVDASGRLASVDDVPVYWDAADSYAPALVQVGATPVLAAGGLTGVGAQWSAPGWRDSRSHAEDVWASAGPVGPALPGLPAGVGVTAAGELRLGQLEWLDARVYDASSRGFLSVDPLDPMAGTGWSGNPYSYAGNDPLHALDPTGLKPVSEAELKEAAKGSWWHRNNGWVIGGGAALLGGALMLTGVGGPAGAMLLSFGADAMIQQATTGKVNYVQAGISGLAGGAGFVASKGLTIGGRVLVNAERVKNMSMAAKVGVRAGIGGTEGYTYQVAGGAGWGSPQAIFGGIAGAATGGAGEFAKPLGERAGGAVSGRILAGVEDKPWVAQKLAPYEAKVGGFVTDHTVRGAYKGGVDASGEFVKQVTDDKAGVDWGKVGGKAVGGSVAKPLPPGWSSPAGKVVGAGFDGAVS